MTDKNPVDLDRLDALCRVAGGVVCTTSAESFKLLLADDREFVVAVLDAYPAMAEELRSLREENAKMQENAAALTKLAIESGRMQGDAERDALRQEVERLRGDSGGIDQELEQCLDRQLLPHGRDCIHGQLARSCDTCQTIRHASRAVGWLATPCEAIDAMAGQIRRQTRELDRLRARVAELEGK